MVESEYSMDIYKSSNSWNGQEQSRKHGLYKHAVHIYFF